MMQVAVPVSGVMSVSTVLISQVTVAEPVIDDFPAGVGFILVRVAMGSGISGVDMLAAEQPVQRAQQTAGSGGLGRDDEDQNSQQCDSASGAHWLNSLSQQM
jgi:hypothetical protein